MAKSAIKMPTEIELKLELDPPDLARLRRSPLLRGGEAVSDRLVSRYFDTPDRLLQRRGYTLRVRETAAGFVQTVKQAGGPAAGLFVRTEWERPIDGRMPALEKSDGPLAGLVAGAPLAVAFTTDVKRSVRMLIAGDTRIEVALDDGRIKAGAEIRRLCEVELELKDGSAEPLFALARELNAIVPLRLGVRSKSERGYALVTGAAPQSYKAEPIALDRAADVRAGFAVIAAACIRHFRLNEPLLIESGAPEPVHQARVALRRLRSAFASFKPLFEEDPVAAHLQDELRWLAGTLGPVRNLDVLLPKLEGADFERLTLERAAAIAEAEAALASLRARRLMLDLAEWLALGAWRTRPAAAAPIADFAVAILDRHRKRIRVRGRHLATLSDPKRHRVRIEANKLRYASEFFASLWAGKKAARQQQAFLAALEDLQDDLGDLNDHATAGELMAHYDLVLPSKQGKGRKVLLKHAAKALDTLIEADRFWRE